MPSFSGACACGAVSYTIEDSPEKAAVCHCKLCQAWSGGVFMYVESQNVTLTNEENLSIWQSSDYAERGFCKTCGSSLFCRITAPGPMQGVHHFGAGTLKDWEGIKLEQEIFIDRKPDGYSLHCDSEKMTSEEFFALFS